MENRKSGVLLHISSLPGTRGIGSFGQAAYDFVDWLVSAKQTYWQILPLCQTSFGDSPYASFSTFAGNPYFIDLKMLEEEGLLTREDYDYTDYEDTYDQINYGKLYELRYPILRKAVSKFKETDDFEAFKKDNSFWLDNYCLYMALKDYFKGCDWLNWPKEYRNKDKKVLDKFIEENKETIRFWEVVQYLFTKQWTKLKKYANDKGIKIIGDCPIYVALDSADVYFDRELFQLEKDGTPKAIAGCPPDGFSADGQLWGNPLYDYKYHEKTGFKWWKQRVSYLCKQYDLLRIDHFRGIEAYWSIPYGEETGKNGKWVKGPNMKLINAFKEVTKDDQIIAEDLGTLTEDTYKMIEESGYPGMRVLEFAFDGDNKNVHLPHNMPRNCVAYIGTHDNEPIMAWKKNNNGYVLNNAYSYLNCPQNETFNWSMINELEKCQAKICIIQAQDILGLEEWSRTNTPNTTGINFKWRLRGDSLNNDNANLLKVITTIYGRD